jgi:hypothetical protein
VEWTGADLHGRVGEHIVECTVNRLASAVTNGDNLDVFIDGDGREVTSQCFHVPFTILDTNECTLPSNHPMLHVCPAPSLCVNTIGSYECLCPRLTNDFTSMSNTADKTFWKEIDSQVQDRSPWELSFAQPSKSSCPSSVSTHECCSQNAHLADGQKCRQRFHCPTDPCTTTSDCSSDAQCVRADSPTEIPNYTCQCPEGLMGNGHACQRGDRKPIPKVMFDGVTPTELTLKHNFYCGCTKPIVDACSGFPPCKGTNILDDPQTSFRFDSITNAPISSFTSQTRSLHRRRWQQTHVCLQIWLCLARQVWVCRCPSSHAQVAARSPWRSNLALETRR